MFNDNNVTNCNNKLNRTRRVVINASKLGGIRKIHETEYDKQTSFDYVAGLHAVDLQPDYCDYGTKDIDTKYGLDNDKHLRWNEAKEVELYSLITQHSTWIVVRRPPGEAVIKHQNGS